ncbi:FadR/GntR family transcriptional regulator [Microbacterium sp. cf332]|uniref:FadR/GntR family transcriptional regulator n=1 Tax=Microbacterium sp. cf332 TaxID=1761804 RepID=UPI000885F0FF|nr:FadR/GntR family transcriptional regulator [Microbacterium sp. cf332]SDQ52319.1 GntR family transcriptional regulator, transcriptional repressor for pyruvate dehydrogenase complex [Microbacterium sp. cf332]
MPDTANADLGPLPRTHALVADDIARHLERLIVAGDLPAGTSLPPERTLAQTLGVSRNALREALTSLTGLGLVERRQGSGTRVSETVPLAAALAGRMRDVAAELRTAAEFRAVIEPQLARLAADRIDARQLDGLRALLSPGTAPEVPAGAEESARRDIAFHTAIAAATGNSLLAALGELTASWTVEARLFSHLDEDGRRLSHEGHARILAAIADRDPEAAEDAMRRHLSEIRDLVDRVL